MQIHVPIEASSKSFGHIPKEIVMQPNFANANTILKEPRVLSAIQLGWEFGNQESNFDSLLINVGRIADPALIVNKYDNYFTRIVQSLAELISNSPPSLKDARIQLYLIPLY